MKQMMNNKRGAFPLIAVIVGIIFLFGFSGIIKFTFFQDKTPYIIIGAIVLLILFSKRE